MPITCVTPAELLHTDFIGLAEGILKPIVIGELFGVTCIGASGGNFSSSPKQLKEYLSIVSSQQNTKRIVYFVDANAVNNDQVYRRDCKTLQLLLDWGFEVKIADWGQLYDRSALDFDEYLAEGNNSYNLISSEDYLSLKDFQSFADLFKPVVHFLSKKPFSSKGFDRTRRSQSIYKFKRGDRAKTVLNLIEKGYQNIIDISSTGTGKSTLIEQIEPEDKLFYVSSAHRNPTTAAAERIFDMPVRHDGLDFDYKRKTPLGNPYQVYSNKNRDPATADHVSVREPDIPSLCKSADIFNSMRSKGYQPDISNGSLNPICNACPKNISCANKIENGSGYRCARKIALKQKKLRISAESLPNPQEFNYTNVILLVDEPSVTLRWTTKISCTLTDFDRALTEVEMRDKELYDLLFPIKLSLYNLFKDAKQKPYGLGDSEVRKALGSAREDLPETRRYADPFGIARLETIVTKLPDLIEAQIDVKSVEKKWRTHASAANQAASTQTFENLQNIHSNWLIPFLKVWCGIKNGALRITNRQVLTVATLNTRFAEIASSAKAVIYLDATIDPELLKTALNLDPDTTAIIKQTTEIPKNLEIIQVTGFKKCLRERSDNLKQRIEAVKAKLAAVHSGDVVFLDYKNMENIHGHWFNHSRGTNEWQEIANLVAIGTPNLNLGEIKNLYLCLYGADNYDEKRFNSFYERFTRQEIIQAIGRLRAGNRRDRQLKFYFLSDFDLGFLSEMGYRVKSVNSFEITPDAGDKTQVKTWGLITIAKTWFEAHGSLAKLTQKKVSGAIGCTQGYVSRLLQSLGGWKEFKVQVEKLLLFLQRDLNNKSNIFDELENQELNYFREILKLPPIEAVKEIVDIIRNCGWDNFLNYLLSEDVIEVERPQILGLVAAIFTSFSLGSEINSRELLC